MVSRVPDGSSSASPDPLQKLLDGVRQQLTSREFDAWRKDVSCEFFPPDRFVFHCATPLRKTWSEQRLHGLLLTEARNILDVQPSIQFRLSKSPKHLNRPSSTQATER